MSPQMEGKKVEKLLTLSTKEMSRLEVMQQKEKKICSKKTFQKPWCSVPGKSNNFWAGIARMEPVGRCWRR